MVSDPRQSQPNSLAESLARQREIIDELRAMGDAASVLMAAKMQRILGTELEVEQAADERANRISQLWKLESKRKRRLRL